MAMSAEHRSIFAALYQQWWRLHMSEKFSSGTKKTKTKKLIVSDIYKLKSFVFYLWGLYSLVLYMYIFQ